MMLFGLYSLYAAATEGVIKAWLANNLPKTKTATGIRAIQQPSKYCYASG
jgi:hypothetical protein